MASLHHVLFSLALPLTSLVACGGGDDGPAPPSGPHHGYVVDSVVVPDDKIFDLDDDGVRDNQLGQVIGILTSQGFDVQKTLDEAVAKGTIILMYDFQTPDLASSAGAGLSVKLGDNPTPAACTSDMDLVCGHHLDGTATFDIAAGSPDNAAINGKIAGGVFSGGPGEILLQIALSEGNPIDLNLIGTQAKATGLSDAALGEVTLAGALTESDLNTKVIPAIHAQLGPIIAMDCTTTVPPDCGCPSGSTGETIINLFDEDPIDCSVSVNEIINNGFIQGALSPDVTINGVEALSLTVVTTAVKAAFDGIDAKRTGIDANRPSRGAW